MWRADGSSYKQSSRRAETSSCVDGWSMMRGGKALPTIHLHRQDHSRADFGGGSGSELRPGPAAAQAGKAGGLSGVRPQASGYP